MRLLPILPAALCVAVGVSAVPTRAWAESPVVLEGADDDMADALRALLPDRERPTTLFEAERISEEAAERALVWLRTQGYYSATVEPQAHEGPAQARLVIAPGPLFRFAAPVVTYDQAPDDDAQSRVDHALGAVDAGAPARAAVVLQAEAEAVAALQRAGYADASAGERRVVVDHATALMTAEFHLQPGDKALLGDVRAEPGDVFRPSFVASLQNWDDGEPYSPQAMTRLRRDLTSTGAVSLATTTLAPPGEDGRRDVIINLEPARRHAYELGVSYSTTEGAGVQAKWTRRNFSGRADALSFEATLAEMQQGITAELLRPHAAGLGHAIRLGASADREDLDAYTRQGVALYASVDASTHLRVGQSYGLRLSADQYDNLAGGSVSDAIVLSGHAALRNDSTSFSLDPRDGSIAEFRIEPSVSTGDETLGFVRFTAEGRIYESFADNDRLTLAARLQTGWLEPVSGSADNVPPDRRFYAGGGGSVRGYGYNTIYPHERDTLGLSPGGNGLLEGSLEARYRFNERWGMAAFVDGGNAFDDWGNALDFRWGAGVGVRYNLGFAPLRFDVAVPFDREEAGEDFALYISIGQAF